MDTGFPGSADDSSPRGTSSGPRPGSGNPSARPRNFPSGSLRVSDADRDAALSELSQHYQAGRLTTEELDDRTTQILSARTGDDLQVQLRDLPNLTAPAHTPPPPQPQQHPLHTAPHVAPRLVLVAAVLAIVAIVLALTSSHGVHPWSAAVPVIVILVVVRRIIGHR
jgi:hypothetical protein